jgi:hypothetical protein
MEGTTPNRNDRRLSELKRIAAGRKRTRSLPVFDMGKPHVDIANRNQLSEAMERK